MSGSHALRLLVLVLSTMFAFAAPARAQSGSEPAGEFGVVGSEALDASVPEAPALEPDLDQAQGAGELDPEAAGFFDEGRLSTAVEIAVLLTILTLLPAILITVTGFTRIVIVLSFVRRALATNELPPTQVILGLALFLTTFVMAPVAARVMDSSWTPYRAGEIPLEVAGEQAWGELSGFLISNTRTSELALFAEMADYQPETADERPPMRVVVPAFVLSELKTSFQMGFLLFLPFLVIDMVVASVLLSMGMFMLPPVMVSTPFKILLFVLVDGWQLVCSSLVTSFITT